MSRTTPWCIACDERVQHTMIRKMKFGSRMIAYILFQFLLEVHENNRRGRKERCSPKSEFGSARHACLVKVLTTGPMVIISQYVKTLRRNPSRECNILATKEACIYY